MKKQSLLGFQNFNNITLRLQEIFNSLQINEDNTGYNFQGYIHDHRQILLLTLEERIIAFRPNNNITPLSQLLDTIVQTQLQIIKDTLTANNLPLFR